MKLVFAFLLEANETFENKIKDVLKNGTNAHDQLMKTLGIEILKVFNVAPEDKVAMEGMKIHRVADPYTMQRTWLEDDVNEKKEEKKS